MTDISPILRHTQSYGHTLATNPLPLRSQPQDIAHMAATMIDRYVTWLNKWQDWNNDPEHQADPTSHYTPQVFLDNPDGYVIPIATYETTGHTVLVLNVYDGDDGGSTTLTGYFTDGGYAFDASRYTGAIEVLLQEFDTLIQFIVNGRHFVNVHETPTSSATANAPLGDPPFGNF